MPDTFPCPYCEQPVDADAGWRSVPGWTGERRTPQEATVQRVRCPHCDKPLVRAAGVEDSPWHKDRAQPDS